MASHLTMSMPEFLFGALIMLVLAACAVRSVIREYRREGERRAMMAATAPLELPDPLDDQFAALERQVAQREGRGGYVIHHVVMAPTSPFNTTIPGGYYLGADGVPHDANGEVIQPRVSSLPKPAIEAAIADADTFGLLAIDHDLASAGWSPTGNIRRSIAKMLGQR